MNSRCRFLAWLRIWALSCVCLGFTCAGLLRADDDSGQPSEAERKAVAALHAKGLSLRINGNYQVNSVSTGPGQRGQITGEDLALLKDLPHLESVTLAAGVTITDADLEHLKVLTQLKTLSLPNARISDDAIAKLRQALPNCNISAGGSSRGFGFAAGPPTIGRGTSPSFGGRTNSEFGLLGRDDVCVELELSFEQLAELENIGQSVTQQPREWFEKYRNSTDELERARLREQMNRGFAEIREQRSRAETKFLAEQLSADQRARLQQLVWQIQSDAALVNGKLADELKVTDKQRTQIRALLVSLTDRSRFGRRPDDPDAPPPGQPVSRDELREKILAVLTEEQRQARTEKLGAPLKVISSEQLGKYYFKLLDRDKNGELSAEEWSQRFGTRMVSRLSIQLDLPASPDSFVAAYQKARAAPAANPRERNRRPASEPNR